MDDDDGGNDGNDGPVRSVSGKMLEDVSVVSSPMTSLYTPSHGAVPAGKSSSPADTSMAPPPEISGRMATPSSPQEHMCSMMNVQQQQQQQRHISDHHDIHQAVWSRAASNSSPAQTPGAMWTPNMEVLHETDGAVSMGDTSQQTIQQSMQSMDVDGLRKFQWAGHGVTHMSDAANVFSPNDGGAGDTWTYEQNQGQQVMGGAMHGGQGSGFEWDRDGLGLATQAQHAYGHAGAMASAHPHGMHMSMGAWQASWQQAVAWQHQQPHMQNMQTQSHQHLGLEQHMHSQQNMSDQYMQQHMQQQTHAKQHMHAQSHSHGMDQHMQQQHQPQHMQPGASPPPIHSGSHQDQPSVTIVGCTVPDFFKQALLAWNQKRIVSPSMSLFRSRVIIEQLRQNILLCVHLFDMFLDLLAGLHYFDCVKASEIICTESHCGLRLLVQIAPQRLDGAKKLQLTPSCQSHVQKVNSRIVLSWVAI
jgi:hypothetical protein